MLIFDFELLYIFLTCFSMNYRDFSVSEIKSGNFTVSNSEITTFYSELFSLFVNSFYQR